MKLIFLENKRNKYRNYIEIFGLSRSGKTTLLKELIKKGKKGILSENISLKNKLFNLIKFILANPIKFVYLFYKLNTNWISLNNLKIIDYYRIFLMRNSYLCAVLAKYQLIKKTKEELYADEFLIQTLQIILQKKSTKEEIRKILKKLPPSGKIIIVELNSRDRYKRIKKTRFPGEQINKDYAALWMKNTEFNYKIIKNLLIEHYGPVIKNPKF